MRKPLSKHQSITQAVGPFTCPPWSVLLNTAAHVLLDVLAGLCQELFEGQHEDSCLLQDFCPSECSHDSVPATVGGVLADPCGAAEFARADALGRGADEAQTCFTA